MDEREVRFLDSTAFISSEVLLHARDTSLEYVNFHLRMRKGQSSFVKTIMQTQVAISNRCLQLCRDHYIAQAKFCPRMLSPISLKMSINSTNDKFKPKLSCTLLPNQLRYPAVVEAEKRLMTTFERDTINVYPSRSRFELTFFA